MAEKYINFSGNFNHQLYYEHTYTQNIKENTTTYYINNIQIGGGWELNFNVDRSVYFTVNGQQKSVYIDRLDLGRGGWKKLGDLSWTIPHNDNGDKSFTLGISADLSNIDTGRYRIGTINHSETIHLARILRGAELTSTLPSAISTSNATFNATCVIRNSSFKTIMELSYTNPKTNAYEWLGVTIEDKSSATLTIPRVHLDKLVGLFPNQNHANITFTLVSRDRNTNGNISAFQQQIRLDFGDEYNPVINSFYFEERKAEVKALVLPENHYVQELSLIVPILSTQAKLNATIEDYAISYNGRSLNGSSSAFTLKINQNGTIAITLRIIDSRGKQATATRQITLISYFHPRIPTFEVYRHRVNQNKVQVSFNTIYANILGKNNYSIQLQFRERNTTNWNTAYSITNQYSVEKRESNYLLPNTFNEDKLFEFRLILTDKFRTSTVINEIGMASYPLDIGLNGIGCGKLLDDEEFRGLQLKGEFVDEKGKNYLLKAYPIGSIFINVDNRNPESFLGGKWRNIGQGRTLVGFDASQAEFDTLKKIGGQKTHTLTIDEMPAHRHKLSKNQLNNSGIQFDNLSSIALNKGENHKGWWSETQAEGRNQPHNNLQPYIVVTFWERYE